MEQGKYKNYTDVEAVDILHQVSAIYVGTKVAHDYGTGESYTAVEVHTLKYIADHDGITVTQLARDYGKTKGAISQILKKIESKGLIYRQADPENDKRYHIYLTEKGKTLDQAHRTYDASRFGESMGRVRQKFSDEEVNIAFTVMEEWLEIRREIQQNRLRKKIQLEKEKRKEKQHKETE